MTNIKIESLTDKQLNSLIIEVKADRMKVISKDRIKYNALINFGFRLETEATRRAKDKDYLLYEISADYGIEL